MRAEEVLDEAFRLAARARDAARSLERRLEDLIYRAEALKLEWEGLTGGARLRALNEVIDALRRLAEGVRYHAEYVMRAAENVIRNRAWYEREARDELRRLREASEGQA